MLMLWLKRLRTNAYRPPILRFLPIFLLISIPHFSQSASKDYLKRCTSYLVSDLLQPEERMDLLKRIFSYQEITIDEKGMLHTEISLAKLTKKFSPNYEITRMRIQEALLEGKHVLFISGSFDLIHAGHAGMIVGSLHNFMIENNVSRDNIFLVVLADEDEMIFGSKKKKWKENGGTESLPRPIQSIENYGFETPVHPRLAELASLPVDLVGFNPSPASEIDRLIHNPDFTKTLKRFLPRLKEMSKEGAKTFLKVQNHYSKMDDFAEKELNFLTEVAARMITALKNGEQQKIIDDYKANYYGEGTHWHISAWQYLTFLYLELHNFPETNGMTRFLNFRDSEYIQHISAWTLAAGSNIEHIGGTGIISTSELIENNDPIALLKTKKLYYSSMRNMTRKKEVLATQRSPKNKKLTSKRNPKK